MGRSPYSGLIADPAKCRLLTVDAKRKLLCELSKRPDRSHQLLHEWTRTDILETFCSECKDGKYRKYNGISKRRIIDRLFTAVNKKSCGVGKSMKRSGPEPNSSDIQLPYKRQKKIVVQALPAIAGAPVTAGISAPRNNAGLCENSACRASLVPADKFCKRCSCCICFKYDDNKDPSLWLCCNSDQLLQEESCGFSCHLECTFRDERSGILQNGQSKKLDGGYYCTHCGKQNDLLGCWKKQLLIAKDAQGLDVLCHRIFLSHKILISTQKYLVLHEIVDTALKKLEGELGLITGHPDKGRGIVSRLAVGAEVQKLCTRAIETLESMLYGALTAGSQIQRLIADPAKCRLLSVDAKRELVCELSKYPDRALELLHEWTSCGIIQIFCSALCKGKKYEGLSKQQILHYLFNAVNEKSCGHEKSMKESGPQPNSSEIQLHYKRQKKIVDQALSVIASAPGCLSWKSTPGEIEDGGHKDGPSEPNTSAQVTSLAKSLNLVPHKQGILLEKSPGSLAPRTGNGIELGDRIIGTGSRSSTDDHVPHLGPLKPGMEPCSPSSSNPSGKHDEGILLEKAPGSLSPRTGNGIELGDRIIGTGSRSSTDDHVPLLGPLKPGMEPCSPSSSNPSGKPDEGILLEKAPGSLSPRTGNGIELGDRIIGTGSRSSNNDHVPHPGPLKPGIEPWSHSSSNPSGKPDEGILLEKTPGSLAPRTGNGIELGDRIIGTGSGSSNDDHVPHPGSLKPGIEPWSPSSSNPSGKPDGIEQTDENAYVSCVKLIRQLECEGHVDAHFRVKFLTWLSVRATRREKEIVSVFVDTFTDDLTSLAGQLRDTFSEAVYS